MNPIVILCPGQGAQAVGMAKAWCDSSPEARAVFQQADDLLGDRLGAPLSTLCFEGPPEALNPTNVAQPALYTAGIASYRAMLASWGITDDHPPLAAAAGLSLGEYTALHVAGAITFEAGLELVTLRGQAMQDAATSTDSGMLALIGADEQQADAVVEEARADGVLVAANFNAPGQIVLSGDAAAIDRAEATATGAGLRATKLAVAGAFHSPIMQPAADRLAEALANTDISTPRCPVYANVNAQPHESNPDSIRARLAEQLTGAVRWSASFSNIAANHADAEFHELAPGKTLAGLARRIDKSVKVISHDAP